MFATWGQIEALFGTSWLWGKRLYSDMQFGLLPDIVEMRFLDCTRIMLGYWLLFPTSSSLGVQSPGISRYKKTTCHTHK